MHILLIPSWYISSYNPLAGIFFKEQAEALAKYNKVGVIAIQEISIREIVNQKKLYFENKNFIENDVETYILQYPALPKLHKIRRKIKSLLFKKLFKRYVKENGMPDIVHLHSYMNGELAIWVKEKYNIPYVVTEHFSGFSRDIVSEEDMDRAKNIFKKSAYNIAVSEEFVKLLNSKFNYEFKYIPNIVNIDFFNIKTDMAKEGFEFINIAFLNKNKNQEMLINAFHRAFKNKSRIKLTIVGDGPEYDNLKALITELNIEEQVSLYGRASREEVKKLLQESNAFVLSSRYETFGVVVIEALASGLPVVATKCGGPESIINDNIGLLSEIDENSLAKNLIQMRKNRLNYNPNYIRNYVKDNFSEEVIVQQLKDVYEKVLKIEKITTNNIRKVGTVEES